MFFIGIDGSIKNLKLLELFYHTKGSFLVEKFLFEELF